MNVHDATEAAYKNGYEQGVADFAERLKKYYDSLPIKSNGAVVSYHIDQIAKELKEKHIICD